MNPERAPAGRIIAGPAITNDVDVACDVVVIGSGAGGAVAAATLAAAGARVVILEEGGHHTRRDFNMHESWAYPTLYQEHGNRATDDLGVIVLQGRTVGGGTTVNWTGSFRPPTRTLELWEERHAVEGIEASTLKPHLVAVEARLGVGEPTRADVNPNNAKLWDGAGKLGWKPELVRRTVIGCARLGYCGMGCPIDAKQSALVTYVDDAIAAGATLYASCRVDTLVTDDATNRRITRVEAAVLDAGPDRPAGRRVVVRPARGVVLAGGAINSPALLLRAGIDPGRKLAGQRTFLHPTVPTLAFFDERIEAYAGPPLSVSSHHFADRGPDRMGYFLETPPIHPMLAAFAFPSWGRDHREVAAMLPHAQSIIALLIDGHGEDPGGTVTIDGGRDGRVRLSYPFHPRLVEAARDAIKNSARAQLAAGAREVRTLHMEPITIRTEADLAKVDAAPFGPTLHTVFSAHQMGGCPMGEDADHAVVTSRGRHHLVDNLWICDGSVFPTSLGVNPQITIYALSRLFATEIARLG